MAISDLTNTTWISKSTYSTSSFYAYDITGTFTIQDFEDYTIEGGIALNGFYKGSGEGYNQSSSNTIGFANRIYTTSPDEWSVTITGGTDVTNANLIAWLETNATQQLPSQPTQTSFKTISYNSSTKVLTINGVDYTLASTASGETVSCGSFGEVSLTSAGVLKINGVEIALPLRTLPSNEVTITFQNSSNGSYCQYIKVYGDYEYTTINGDNFYKLSSSDELGAISSAVGTGNGSITVSTTSGKLFILGKADYYTEAPGTITTSSGITSIGSQGGVMSYGQYGNIYIDNVEVSNVNEYMGYSFEVIADGTINVSGANWDE